MRSLSFVDHIDFKDVYTNNSRNYCLYDVDNDGDNELVIGAWDSGRILENGEADAENIQGSIHILKYKRVWKAAYHLGMVLCVTAGSIYPSCQTWIIALCADSHCYAFDASTSVYDYSEITSVKSGSKLQHHNSHHHQQHQRGSSKMGQKIKIDPLKMVHHQELAYNAKDVCILNQGEIAVAHSDRVVRLYSWCSFETQKSSSSSLLTTSSSDSPSNLGEFILLIKWELAGQVNRIDTCWTPKHGLILIASQPSGGFAHLHRKFERYHKNVAPTLTYYPPRVTSNSNLETRTWLVGNVNYSKCHEFKSVPPPYDTVSTTIVDNISSYLICLSTADGNIFLVDPTHENDTDLVMWSIQVHTRSELFGLCKMKLTKDDGDQIVVCSWDGATYIFDVNNNSVCFPLGQSCQAFIAGLYAIEPGQNLPVLIYSTFDRNTLIYYNLQLDHIAAQSLHSTILKDHILVEKLQSRNIDPHNPLQLSEAIRYILYELPKQ